MNMRTRRPRLAAISIAILALIQAGPIKAQGKIWRDAATGKIIAESDFFEPRTINSLTPPGFGGRVYFPSAAGKGFYVLQAMPKPAAQAGK